MTLRSRFLLVLSLFTIVALASGLTATWALLKLGDLLEVSRRSYHDQLVAVRLETRFLRCTQALSSVLAGNPEARQDFERLLDELRPGLEELQRPDLSPAAQDAVNSVRQNLQQLHLAAENSLFMSKNEDEDTRSLKVFQGWLKKVFAPQLARDTERVVQVLQAELAAAEADARRGVSRILLWILVGFVALVLLVLAALIGLRRSLVVPVEALLAATHEIARGREPRTLPLERADEIGRLARSVQDMARDLAESQQELVQKEQFAAVGQMTSSVAHNLRNPLASIRGLAQNILLELEPGDRREDSLRTILQTVDRMDRWLKGMLTSLRPIPLRLEQADPADLVRDLERVAHDFAREKGVTVELDVVEPLPAVAADRNRLDQALIAILHNAVEASPSEATVRLGARCDRDRNQVQIVVTDHGPGMQPKVRERLFRPAFSTKENGTGMGLYLAHRIILEHQGHIDVESAPGEGTTMTVRLPAGGPEAKP